MSVDPNTGQLLPIRKRLDHRGPLSVGLFETIYFVTVTAQTRNTTHIVDHAEDILSAARYYQGKGIWFLYLLLVMPDHIHMLVHIPPSRTLADVVGHWKSFLTTQKGLRFQPNFFDTRIRDQEHFAEKWDYVCRNPVAKSLVAIPREWPWSIAFDPQTGIERPHR